MPLTPEIKKKKPSKNSTFKPRSVGKTDCTDPIIGGIPSFNYDWVPKPDNNDIEPIKGLDLPPGCIPWYYYYMKVGSIWSFLDIITESNFLARGEVVGNNGRHVLSNKKNLPFDMPHPNKKGWRLRHVCIEGPEIAVYCRGKVPENGVINLPSYWEGLVNKDDMSISLTPIGHWQELFVKEVKSNQVIVGNNAANAIKADYYIVGRRLDDDLIVEYEGDSYEDYPGGNEGYSFNYDNDYVESIIKKEVNDIMKNNV